MIRFASLGSGSKGNALLVQSGQTRLLVDCGFGPRELARRLARLGVVPEQLDAVLVTHEHSDHIAGLAALVR
ncbi:MAG: MBL fold metallo-hydrolase, partial [Burkholderiaceae bacterium]|nr:MBL fold metallo-hydrolase [Burkholderiaceae bacterium]